MLSAPLFLQAQVAQVKGDRLQREATWPPQDLFCCLARNILCNGKICALGTKLCAVGQTEFEKEMDYLLLKKWVGER